MSESLSPARYEGERRVALTERECRDWIAVLKSSRGFAPLGDRIERAVNEAARCGIVLEDGYVIYGPTR